MPSWLIALLVGSSGGGLVGYLFRGWVDDRFARAREARAIRQSDVRALRDALHVFLGQPRAHFAWLQSVRDVNSAEGQPSPAEKAEIIATWVYENAMKFPEDRRGPMYRIMTVGYQLARGDRHFLDQNPNGYDLIESDWQVLDRYAQHLTHVLHDPDSPGGAA